MAPLNLPASQRRRNPIIHRWFLCIKSAIILTFKMLSPIWSKVFRLTFSLELSKMTYSMEIIINKLYKLLKFSGTMKFKWNSLVYVCVQLFYGILDFELIMNCWSNGLNSKRNIASKMQLKLFGIKLIIQRNKLVFDNHFISQNKHIIRIMWVLPRAISIIYTNLQMKLLSTYLEKHDLKIILADKQTDL